jgi:agmatinase
MTYKGDQAFDGEGTLLGTHHELEFAGATSMFRRAYSKTLDGLDAVILGIPYDLSTTYRPGARFGPRALRASSSSITHGRVWPWNFNPFDTLRVTDWGDIMFDEGDTASMLKSVHTALATLRHSTVPIVLGGDHYISLPVLRALHDRHGKLSLLHFDAHSDTWTDERHHHGSVFYHALNEGLIDAQSSVQVGIRTFNSDDHGLSILTTPWVERNGPTAAAHHILDTMQVAKSVYISIDIDVLDPAFAPGTGTPSPGGLSTYALKQIIYGLAKRQLPVRGVDLVEVSPPYDHAELTSLTGASILLDVICLLAAYRNSSGSPDDLQGGSGKRTA